MATGGAENRQYHRTEGVLFFACRRPKKSAVVMPDFNRPEMYTLFQVMRENLEAYIEYRNPNDADIYKQFMHIVNLLYQEVSNQSGKTEDTTLYYKQPAIISGDAFEFATSLPYEVGEKISLQLCFPIYPFTSVHLQTEVIKLKSHSGIYGDKRVVLKYSDAVMDDQEQIMKYVAAREREVIRQKRYQE